MSLISKFRESKIGTSTIADVLDIMGVSGVLNHQIKSANLQDYYFVGEAYCVQWDLAKKRSNITDGQKSTWAMVKDFIDIDLASCKDKVYVAGASGLMKIGALAGGISCTYFESLGFEGVVLGGAVRDAKEVKELTIPVLATNFIPTDTQGFMKACCKKKKCTIDNITINNGDMVVGDATGIVVIPANLASIVYDKALEIEEREVNIIEKARQGENICSYIESLGRI